MIKPYYTGVLQDQEIQSLPFQSIGGHISSTPVQQDLNSLFPDTAYQLSKKPCHILIALQNDGGSTVTGTVSIESISTYFDYQLATVAPALDGQNKPVFEQLTNQSNKPLYAIFGTTASFSITASNYCGVWIRRILKSSVDIDNPDFSDDSVLTMETQTISPIEENFALIVNF